MSRRAEATLIVLVLLVAAWLRLRGLDWGLPYPYHPDEGSILFHSLAFGTGDLNPHWFRWPSLLMYFMFGVYGVYFIFGKVLGTFGAPIDILRSYLTDLSPFWLMGRWVSALAGVATVWVTYRMGKRVFGAAAGLVAALFLSVVYLHVRDSHYATPDVAATLLAAASLLAALRACESGRVRDLVLSGLLAGLSASAKYPGIVAAAGTMAAFSYLASRRAIRFPALVWAGAACVLGFVVGTPYSVLAMPEFARDVTRQFAMVSSAGVAQAPTSFGSGIAEVFGKTVGRGITYPIAALALIGALWPLGAKGGQRPVLVAYLVMVFLFAVLITVKRSTYLTPALPAIAVLAGGALEGVLRRVARALGAPAGATVSAAAVALAVLAVIPSVRFGTAIASPDTRTLAKIWVEREVPAGAGIAVEEYGPVLNRSEEQLKAMVAADTTAVEEWKGAQEMLSRLRLEVGLAREPKYGVYGIGHGEGEYRLPEAALEPLRLASSIESLGIRFVVLSSKAAPWRAMDGAEAPEAEVESRFYDWLRGRATLRERFVAGSPVPRIDRGPGRSFHDPVIEIYEVERSHP